MHSQLKGDFYMDQFYNFAQVASNCSKYEPYGSTMTNGTCDAGTECSCLNCHHFENHHCDLDLYDKIEKNLTKYSSEL